MKAIVLSQGGGPEVLEYKEIPTPTPEPGQALVRLKAAGLNHRDVWQRKGYAEKDPTILGSDGAGIVESVGRKEDNFWEGQEVVINPSLYWGDKEDAPGPGFQILGIPTPGTYAEYVVVPVENLAAKPAHLNFVQAAALPLAGLTAWRGIFTQGQLRPGQTLLLPGIGSGVAGMALMFAKKAGVRVIVTSSDEEKLAKAKAQGADIAVNYTQADWEQQVQDQAGTAGVDMVLDHSGEKTIPAGLRLIRPGGRVVFLGVTTGTECRFNIREAFYRQIHLTGTTMGSPREFEAMFRFVGMNKLVPEVNHRFPLEQAAQAHALMEQGGQYGKIMLEI